MRIADEIVIVVGGEEIVLHPSLRLAIQLERRLGGFAKLIAEIADGTLTTACELIAPHDPLPNTFRDARVLDAGIDQLAPALIEYVLALAGVDPEAAAKQTKSPNPRKTVPLGAHLADLYRIGTGWLGWTPETTLDATPTEIMEAYRGRTDMLKAIFGSSEKPKDDRPIDQKVRSIFAGIGTVKEAV